ncbi:Glycosyltransferase, GT2 family [Nitrosomonas eutropha]|uniref:glycosyltransferase family 2 protein n=1 Tax=Nitrosomonas TaxID=914 RepID=UPI0008950621|nr:MULTISPECIES: glycosyltransferase family 2 protein [Nitrosomonas]MXS79607.1 glycosyltransferase family 2 protein [Nitrosomonas sp. GH22]SDW21673.1 Glycosyltransferase, GT2 family [Nitrosomonas eutropha]
MIDIRKFAIPADKTIDVVIPVYNAPDWTRRCIDSIVAHLNQSIRRIIVQDDASGHETREMLDNLSYDCVDVHHAEKNQGFGISVNAAVNRSDASYVFILNSDTEVSQDFLPLLCTAFTADPELAAIVPAGNSYAQYDLGRYMLREAGYIPNYYLRGHAILIRRDVFQEIGGFDPAFGRGYYEDIDLGRRLDLHGWRFGIHPGVCIYHKRRGSFGNGRSQKQLSRRNRAFYLSRYPDARQNILLFSTNGSLVNFPSSVLVTIENVFRKGGYVHWFTSARSPTLLCLQMYSQPLRLTAVIWTTFRNWWRADRRISTIWMMDDIPFLLRTLLIVWGRVFRLEVKKLSFDESPLSFEGAILKK